jgi:hypothetical protein
MGMMNDFMIGMVPKMMEAINGGMNPNKNQNQNGEVQSKSATTSEDNKSATSDTTNKSKDSTQLLSSGSNNSSLGGGSRNKGVEPSQLALSKTTLLGG